MRPNVKYVTPYLTKEFIQREQVRRRLQNIGPGMNTDSRKMVFLYGLLGVLIATIGWVVWHCYT